MRRLVALLLIAGAAAQAAPVSVDEAPPAAVQHLNGYSRCVAEKEPRLAAKMLSYPLSGPEQAEVLERVLDRYYFCRNYEMPARKPNPLMLVSGMAEELFLANHGGEEVAALVGESGAKARNLTEDVALCLVRRNPASALKIIQTVPGSEEEKVAMGGLVSDAGSCVEQGKSVAVNAVTLRAWAATGLYLAAEAARAG
jgi:hypothetical protein